MNLKMLNILLCVILANILGNCALGSSSQNGEDILENETLNFGPETLNELKSLLWMKFIKFLILMQAGLELMKFL